MTGFALAQAELVAGGAADDQHRHRRVIRRAHGLGLARLTVSLLFGWGVSVVRERYSELAGWPAAKATAAADRRAAGRRR